MSKALQRNQHFSYIIRGVAMKYAFSNSVKWSQLAICPHSLLTLVIVIEHYILIDIEVVMIKIIFCNI